MPIGYRLLLVALLLIVYYPSTSRAQEVNFGYWNQDKRNDGYVVGNGKLYALVGLGKELSRHGKSALTSKDAPLTRIAWIIGPHYTIGNLGYGWEILPGDENQMTAWEQEKLIPPADSRNYWMIHCENSELELTVDDHVPDDEPILLRRIYISRKIPGGSGGVFLHIPVLTDPRNARYAMFNGDEVNEAVVSRWQRLCGPNLQPRPSLPVEKLQQFFPDQKAIVHRGANHALWQEISTIVPDDSLYQELFPYRALATTITSSDNDIDIAVNANGFRIRIDPFQPGTTKELYLWMVTVSGSESELNQKALHILDRSIQRSASALIQSRQDASTKPLIQPIGFADDPITRIIEAGANLAKACQAEAGGLMAQPYMYPMYYVRDQYGSFRLFLSLGEHRRAFDVLRFYVAMQNRDGIQNAHDAPPYPPDAAFWHPRANQKDGHWQRAEVPSYIILMARDYFMHSNDLEGIKPFYPRLAYNLRIQQRNRNGLLPWAHDESYTNSPSTRPHFGDEMGDSNILFLAAAEFMTQLATLLNQEEDAREFKDLHDETYRALMQRLWLAERNYFAYARDSSMNENNIDTRPALDALLRWAWLELADPRDEIVPGCLNTVLRELINPIRVVPETFDFTAGMDPGYVLYGLARRQHPAMHQAAEMLLNYASTGGLFSEYYRHADGLIIPFGGTLRPWESGICAQALIQYLLGLRVQLPVKRIFLQPHLPPCWEGWRTKPIELPGEGTISLQLQRNENSEILFSLERRGGISPLQMSLEFGAFGPLIKPISEKLSFAEDRQDRLVSEFILDQAEDTDSPVRVEFRFSIVPRER